MDGEKAAVIHYGNPGMQGADATFMGYATSNEWVLDTAKVPTHATGDVLNFYVQSFSEIGSGTSDIEKAESLNAGQYLGSEWLTSVSITFE